MSMYLSGVPTWLAALRDPGFILDAEGTIIETNAAFRELSDAVPGELRQAPSTARLVRDEASWPHVLEGLRSAGFVRGIPIELRRTDRGVTRGLASFHALDERRTRFVGLFVAHTPHSEPDTSPPHEDPGDSAETRLVGRLAHDLSNILTTVLGNIDLTLTTGATDPKTSERLETILTETLRARTLVRELIALSSDTRTRAPRKEGYVRCLHGRNSGARREPRSRRQPKAPTSNDSAGEPRRFWATHPCRVPPAV